MLGIRVRGNYLESESGEITWSKVEGKLLGIRVGKILLGIRVRENCLELE